MNKTAGACTVQDSAFKKLFIFNVNRWTNIFGLLTWGCTIHVSGRVLQSTVNDSYWEGTPSLTNPALTLTIPLARDPLFSWWPKPLWKKRWGFQILDHRIFTRFSYSRWYSVFSITFKWFHDVSHPLNSKSLFIGHHIVIMNKPPENHIVGSLLHIIWLYLRAIRKTIL